jgi:hypothetical protein
VIQYIGGSPPLNQRHRLFPFVLGRVQLSRRSQGDGEGDVDPGRQRHPSPASREAATTRCTAEVNAEVMPDNRRSSSVLLTTAEAQERASGAALCAARMPNSTDSET